MSASTARRPPPSPANAPPPPPYKEVILHPYQIALGSCILEAISVVSPSESSIHWIFGRAEKLKQKAAEIQSGIDGAEALVYPRLSFFFCFFVLLLNIADSSLLPSSRRIHHPHELALNLALELYSAIGRKKKRNRKYPCSELYFYIDHGRISILRIT